MSKTAVDHVPVMKREVIAALNVRPGGRYIDGTVGAGGHAEAIMEAATPGGSLLGIDLDGEALELASKRLQRFGEDVRLEHGAFSEMDAIAAEYEFAPVHLSSHIDSEPCPKPAQTISQIRFGFETRTNNRESARGSKLKSSEKRKTGHQSSAATNARRRLDVGS